MCKLHIHTILQYAVSIGLAAINQPMTQGIRSFNYKTIRVEIKLIKV